MASSPRDAAYFERKRAHAEKNVRECITKIKRTTTSLDLWQRRERYYAAQIGSTPEQRKQRRDEQLAARNQKTKTRAIRVHDED